MAEKKLVPELRFPGFEGGWESRNFSDVATFSKGTGISKADIAEEGTTECIRYGELYTKYSEVIDDVESRTLMSPKELVLSEAGDVIIPASGESQKDIATASCVLRGGIALGGDLNIIRTQIDGIFLAYYLNNKRKYDIASLAQGISVIHLYSSQLRGLSLNLPVKAEQQKIASFLSAIDTHIRLLQKKKKALESYKKGVMQKIFNQEIRFKDDNGKSFSSWEELRLSEVLFEHKRKNKSNLVNEVFSVAKEKGIINQIEHLGRSYSAESVGHYKIIEPFDIVYTKSPTSDFPFGIIKQNLTGRIGILSPLYAVFKPSTPAIGTILHNYFLSSVNTYNYLVPLVQKGAKNTMNISNDDFLKGAKISLPISFEEQQKIASFFSSIDEAINQLNRHLILTKTYKKGLLQKMFV